MTVLLAMYGLPIFAEAATARASKCFSPLVAGEYARCAQRF
jgi:hypothetical protein